MTTSRRPYRTDLSDARWALIEPMLSAWRAKRAGLAITKIKHELREIVNAILYVNRTGIAWECLPHDFPPYVPDGVSLLCLVGEGRHHRGGS
jgi:transposase